MAAAGRVDRTPWGKFPDVSVHSTTDTLTSHPLYPAAQAGDLKAATILVREIYRSAAPIPAADFVVPIAAQPDNGIWNALPIAFAQIVAERLKAKLLPTIVQANSSPHRHQRDGADPREQPIFDGKVPSGTFIIADDHVCYGSAIANLRGHIEVRGGKVLAATSLTADPFALKLALPASRLRALQERFRNELAIIPDKLGFQPEFLTAREALYINGLPHLIGLRNPGAAPQHSVCPSL
jgi:hypothetical protein